MKSKEHFEMLLRNFRLPEAAGYIASLVETGRLSAERGKDWEGLICAYRNVICNSLWDEEGVFILESGKINASDILEERNRLCGIIREWIKSEKRPILFYISAYYALVNEDRMHLKMSLSEIEKQAGEGIAAAGIPKTIGGYEKFQLIGNKLEKYCSLNAPVFDVIDELSIRVKLCEEK